MEKEKVRALLWGMQQGGEEEVKGRDCCGGVHLLLDCWGVVLGALV